MYPLALQRTTVIRPYRSLAYLPFLPAYTASYKHFWNYASLRANDASEVCGRKLDSAFPARLNRSTRIALIVLTEFPLSALACPSDVIGDFSISF